MINAIYGKKVGMTQVFSEDDRLIPVTVIQAEPNKVCQVKTKETDGYEAVQMGFGSVKPRRVNKPMTGHFAKQGVEPTRYLREVRVENAAEYKVGDEQTVAAFAEAKIAPARSRFITGRAADVLPRMNEASYDIVLVDADTEGVIEYVEHGLRLVRAGGTVLVPRALRGGAVADPVRRDPITTAFRSLIQETQASPAVLGALSIVGEGLLQLTTVPAEL